MTSLTIALWDAEGGTVPTDSDQALEWWAPALGPAAVLIVHRLARIAPTLITLPDLAHSFGLETIRAHNALERLQHFRLIRIDLATAPTTVHVRRSLPALSPDRVDQLPDYLRAGYLAAHREEPMNPNPRAEPA